MRGRGRLAARGRLCLLALLGVACWGLGSGPAAAAPRAASGPPPRGSVGQEGPVALVDVPFLSQRQDLCGGAAAAMLMRYWGDGEAVAAEFAPLVDAELEGIRAADLTAELRRRGWRTRDFRGTPGEIRDQLRRGRPPIALIEVAPGRRHYVVITAWTPESVMFHDPAVAPFRVMDAAAFDHAWEAAGRWALLVLPPDAPAAKGSAADASGAPPAPAAPGAGSGCAARVRAVVDGVERVGLEGAEARLAGLTEACPDAAPAFRELAAVRFRQERWPAAAAAAREATRLDPDDEHAWRLLATATYLSGDPAAALEVWNRLGEPRLDLVQVRGLRRLRHRVVEARVGLRRGELLSPELLRRARRRVERIPSVSASRVSLRPQGDGRASLDVAVVEEPLIETHWAHWTRAAAIAVAGHRLEVGLANPSGGGERLELEWRWEDNRPQGRFELSTPDVLGIPGVLHVEGLIGESTYSMRGVHGQRLAAHGLAISADGPWLVETRRRAGASVSTWISDHLRLEVGTALDRWSTRGADLSFGAGLRGEYLGRRLRLGAEIARAVSLDSAAPYSRWRLQVGWRSGTDWREPMLRLRAGHAGVGHGAPLGLWPRGDKGATADALMRGRELRTDGIVTGSLLGRRILWAGAEASAFPVRLGPVRLGGSLFVDVARSWKRLRPEGSGWRVDAGPGLHLGLPGRAGTVSLWMGTPLEGWEPTLSAAWTTSPDDWW